MLGSFEGLDTGREQEEVSVREEENFAQTVGEVRILHNKMRRRKFRQLVLVWQRRNSLSDKAVNVVLKEAGVSWRV